MDSTCLYKLKNDTKCVFLSENIIGEILDSFSKSNIKTIKCVKKPVNVMKSNKIQVKKDLIENKIIMIMNKISDNNINELIADYLCNLQIETEEKYNIILEEIFNKMIKDIKFIDNYIKFSIKIFIIEKKRLNLFPEHFIELIKNNLMSNKNEQERAGCFEIIKLLNKYEFFNINILHSISNFVLNKDYNYIDVYYWFNNNININIEYKNKILEISNKCTDNREKILIESLVTNNNKNEDIEIEEIIDNDSFITSVVNIIEEYDFLKSIDEVIEFIKTDCENINQKNSFCKEVISFYIDKEINDGLNLMDTLIKKKVLYKSNISKSLVMFLNANHDDTYKNKIIDILKFLKNNNITKNIEYLFKKYKVKIFYE
jgi:hypothetical protein